MAEQPIPESTACEGWSRVLTNVLRHQWWLFDVQYQAGLRLLELLAPVHQPPAPAAPNDFRDLERRAAECARRGAALPREVYDVWNRQRIDWSRFPEWARPVDPEMFTGCAHEG